MGSSSSCKNSRRVLLGCLLFVRCKAPPAQLFPSLLRCYTRAHVYSNAHTPLTHAYTKLTHIHRTHMCVTRVCKHTYTPRASFNGRAGEDDDGGKFHGVRSFRDLPCRCLCVCVCGLRSLRPRPLQAARRVTTGKRYQCTTSSTMMIGDPYRVPAVIGHQPQDRHFKRFFPPLPLIIQRSSGPSSAGKTSFHRPKSGDLRLPPFGWMTVATARCHCRPRRAAAAPHRCRCCEIDITRAHPCRIIRARVYAGKDGSN